MLDTKISTFYLLYEISRHLNAKWISQCENYSFRGKWLPISFNVFHEPNPLFRLYWAKWVNIEQGFCSFMREWSTKHQKYLQQKKPRYVLLFCLYKCWRHNLTLCWWLPCLTQWISQGSCLKSFLRMLFSRTVFHEILKSRRYSQNMYLWKNICLSQRYKIYLKAFVWLG